ncbi:MAG: hypothetical protein Q8R47_02200 [Nanoarchaeota archaeon]|nr:hypothetical protein [Nanoarchaeota archaeon]
MQYLFDLEKGQDYEVSVQCIEEINTVQVNFHFAEDVSPPQITVKFPQQNSIVTTEMLSDITIYGTEAWKVENGDDQLEFGEPIGNVSQVIGGNELITLADNNWIIKEIEYNYNQSLSFPVVTNYYNQKSGVVTYAEDDDDITDYFLKFNDNSPIATYNLAFTSPAPSEIDGDILTDFQGTTLALFGKEYYVFRAERPSQNSVKLTLMNNFVSDVIGKDETKTFSLSEVGYEITPTFMNEEFVQFKINGETTSMLKVGRMYVLSNGATLVVEDIQEGKAKFILGTEKLELQDKDITDNLGNNYEVKVNSETIDGAAVKIKGTDDNSVLSISSLEVNMSTQEDYFIASGETLLGQPELGEKDLLFTQNWDIRFDGWTDEAANIISLKDKSGEKEYELTFTNVEGNVIELPIAYAEGSNSVILGNQDDRLNLENSNIADDQYFILNTGTDENSVTNVVKYKGADGGSSGVNDMKFKILATGETVEIPITFNFDGEFTATLELSGTIYTITSVGDTSQDDYNISITGGADTSSSNAYGWENYVIAKGGAKIDIAENEANGIKVSVSLIDSNNVGDSIIVSAENPYVVSSVDIVAVDNQVDLTNYAGIVLTYPDDDDNAYGYAVNGALVKLNNPNSPTMSSNDLEIEWPEKQRLPLVYLTTTTKNSTKPALPLELSTDENAVCSYKLGSGYQEMGTTSTKFHSQNLFDLEDGKDYEISVQCVDESGNTKTELLKFHFGTVAQPAPPQQNPPSNSGSSGSSSNNNDEDDDEAEEETTKVTNNPPQEMKKTAEQPVEPLADSPAEVSDAPSFSNKLTAAVVGIREKGGLLYVAGFVLILFSLVGIKFVYSKKN